MSAYIRLSLLILVSTLPVACSDMESPRAPNVIVIVIDTLRADALPPYGGEPETAPFIAQLAAKSVVFDHAWAASSWTAPSTASIFTSRYPNEHGVVSNIQLSRDIKRYGVKHELNRIPASLETMPEFMKSMGYATFGVTDNINIGEAIGFHSGFDRFHLLEGYAKSGAKRLSEQMLSWKEEIQSAEQYFLYLHYMDPHKPYGRHPEWMAEGEPEVENRRMDLAAYRSEIRTVDEMLREIFSALEVGDDTIVILTADHGEEFMDHGHTGHKWSLYSELTNIPLIIHVAEDGPRGRSQANVSNMDIMPTLRELLGAPDSDQDRGVSLLGVMEETERGLRQLHSMRTATIGLEQQELRAIVRGKYKLICNGRTGRKLLFDLEADAGEQHNLARRNGKLVTELLALIEQQEERASREQVTDSAEIALNAEEIKILQTLGYTGG